MLFSHPAMLWGLLAVLIPVAIHLFNFRRYRKVYFSNVDALSELQHESRRRNELRRWLVLLMRVLAVAFLALAFAGPVLPERGSSMQSGATTVSIYIDNSFSMEGASRDGSQLDVACRKAREVASAYGHGDRFQLITGDMAGSQMRWLSRDELLSALDEVQPSPAVRTVSEVASRQAAFLAQSGAANRHAYIISDFQQSTADLAALPSDSSVRFTLVPLTGTVTDNIYIDTLRLDAPAYFVGGAVAVEAVIVNGGSRDVEKVPVRLFVDGRERALATVDLAAGASERCLLLFTIDADGWHEGKVEISDYPVTYDDSYFFALGVGERLAVLEVDGHGANASLQRLFAADSAVTYRHTTLLSQSDAQASDFIILNEPRQLASGDAAWLADWVEGGGSLLVIPSAEGVPQELGALLDRLPAPRLDRWVPRPTRASAVDYNSSLYRNVFSGHSDEMELPTVQGHYSYASAQSMRQSVIALSDGGDLLSLTPAGLGRVYLFTVPLDDTHTDFIRQALFVPTLYNMALYSRSLPPPCHTLGGSEPIALQGRYDPSAKPPELTDGDEVSVIPDLRSVGGRQLLVPHSELSKAGVYRLADERLAFNYGRRESQLAFLTPSEVADAIEGREGYSLLQPTSRPLDQVLRERDGGRHLWRLCLLLALAALAVETVLLITPFAKKNKQP